MEIRETRAISPQLQLPSLTSAPATVEDVRKRARKRLPRLAFDFIDGGADAELSLRRNAEAFELRTLRPRQLVGVETRDLSTTVLGVPVRMPVLIAPTGMSRVAGRGGDIAGARAAGLDVFETEPPVGTRILTAPNVTASPHHAGTSDVSNLEMSRVATACALTILGGGRPPSLINPDALANARS